MKYLKRLLLFLIIITSIMLIYAVLYPNIELNTYSTEVNSDFILTPKAYNLFTNLSNRTTLKYDIDNSKVGEYEVNASIKYLFYRVNKKFKFYVYDNTKPVINLKGDNPAHACPNTEYNEEGYSASDNYDGDLTDKVVIKKIDNSVLYSVADSSKNEVSIERKIIFADEEEPIIELKGNSEVTVYLGNNYSEPGYTAYDNCDGDLTEMIISTGDVDTNKIGTYKITYEVSDNSGNKTIVYRTVNVVKRKVYNGYGNGVIYLTFDDGPSFLTGDILNILDEESVKATFFVTGVNQDTIRAYNNGHTIALHTNSHDYSYVYSSADNYFNDLNKISDKVYNTLGFRSKIIRFPGGSSNTVSRKYSIGIMSYLANEVVQRGYTYFDWNVDSNDAGSDIYNSSSIYYNVVSGLSHNKTNVVLMHDSGGHSATVNALRNIIRYGKDNGYSFKAITENTPVVVHGVNN